MFFSKIIYICNIQKVIEKMIFLYDLIINLITSAISFVFGFVFHKIVRKYKECSKAVIWKIFENSNEVAICLSIRKGPLPSSTARTSIEEVTGLIEVISVFKSMGIRYNIITENVDNVLRQYKNILSVGGPRANITTELLMNKYKDFIPVKFLDESVGFEVGHKVYRTIYNEDKTKVLADYAMIVSIREKEKSEKLKSRIIAFGCRGYGTCGSLECIQSKEMIDIYIKYHKPDSFVAIIKVVIEKDGIHTHVEEFFSLNI